jgi:hypothetical protein
MAESAAVISAAPSSALAGKLATPSDIVNGPSLDPRVCTPSSPRVGFLIAALCPRERGGPRNVAKTEAGVFDERGRHLQTRFPVD